MSSLSFAGRMKTTHRQKLDLVEKISSNWGSKWFADFIAKAMLPVNVEKKEDLIELPLTMLRLLGHLAELAPNRVRDAAELVSLAIQERQRASSDGAQYVTEKDLETVFEDYFGESEQLSKHRRAAHSPEPFAYALRGPNNRSAAIAYDELDHKYATPPKERPQRSFEAPKPQSSEQIELETREQTSPSPFIPRPVNMTEPEIEQAMKGLKISVVNDWSSPENFACIEAMLKTYYLEPNHGATGGIEKRFERVSKRMATAGIAKSAPAVKNQWNRYLRELSGFDERQKPGNSLSVSKLKKPAKKTSTLSAKSSASNVKGKSSAASLKKKNSAATVARGSRVTKSKAPGRPKPSKLDIQLANMVDAEKQRESSVGTVFSATTATSSVAPSPYLMSPAAQSPFQLSKDSPYGPGGLNPAGYLLPGQIPPKTDEIARARLQQWEDAHRPRSHVPILPKPAPPAAMEVDTSDNLPTKDAPSEATKSIREQIAQEEKELRALRQRRRQEIQDIDDQIRALKLKRQHSGSNAQ